MAIRALQPCAHPGCRELLKQPGYCVRHAAQHVAEFKERLRPRTTESASKRGYDWRWVNARKHFLRANPLCATCGKPATVVDHIIPHRGDKAIFWDFTNWQPLCADCHNHKTFSEMHPAKPKPAYVKPIQRGLYGKT